MTAGAPPFERLRVIRDDVPHEGALNMALDEALLQGRIDLPLLRFYRWTRPTVTFGYFDPVAEARRIARGRGVVRRLTGGGIVEHGDDLTFSFVVPRTDAFTRLPSTESYRQIHAALARALERVGFVSQALEDAPPPQAGDRQPNACFEHPVRHDLMTDGKKVAGGAQRRTRLGLLHQGSILHSRATDHVWRDRLCHEIPRMLARNSEEHPIDQAEFTRAEMLAAEKYATPAWTDRV